MREERVSVLWLCGPPGAGKSAAGWALYAGLARSGARAGFADIDQLGMCLPAPPDDPERYRLKERGLSAVVGNFRAAGCDAVVVSGDLGPSPGIWSGTVPGACLRICRPQARPASRDFRDLTGQFGRALGYQAAWPAHRLGCLDGAQARKQFDCLAGSWHSGPSWVTWIW